MSNSEVKKSNLYVIELGLIFNFELLGNIVKAKNLILEKANSNNNIYIFGNGGSFSIAEHAAVDLSKGIFENSGKKINITSPLSNNSLITAIANDYSFDRILSEYLKCHGEQNDLIILISSSGNSLNVLRSIEFAKQNGMQIISIIGFSKFNKINLLSDVIINFAVDDYGLTEDAAQITFHIIKKLIIDEKDD